MKDKIPDRRAMEKVTSDIGRMLEGQNFDSEEDMKVYLDSIVQGGQVPKAAPKNALQFAQDIMYDAWETESQKERIKLAKEALSISPDCADAYNLLAEEEAQALEEAKKLYQKGVASGRRALGEKMFQEILEDGEEGHFWGYTPSRPYMRSRAGLMECLWGLGKHDEAIEHAMEMLKLNVNDNQGIRYILTAYLADLKRYDDLEEFMSGEFAGDCSAEWLYIRVLLSFVKEGDSVRSSRDLKDALKENIFVPEYLTGKKSIPRVLPDRVTMGGEDEGFCCASRYLNAWKNVPGAIDWLKEKAGINIVPKAGRNEPCPCGSGKKYKKCCGA